MIKKFIIFYIFLVFSFNAQSQIITGIGDYKIGMAADSFLEIPAIKNKLLEEKTTSMLVPEKINLWRTNSASNINGHQRIYSADVVKYEFLTSIGIPKASGEDSYWIEVFFYKDLLASVRIIDTESTFEDILTQKYGKPQYENKTKKVVCQNGYGAQSTHLDGTIYWKWKSGRSITAEYAYSFFSCGKSGGSYTVSNKEIMKIIDQVETKLKKEKDLKELQNKSKESKL